MSVRSSQCEIVTQGLRERGAPGALWSGEGKIAGRDFKAASCITESWRPETVPVQVGCCFWFNLLMNRSEIVFLRAAMVYNLFCTSLLPAVVQAHSPTPTCSVFALFQWAFSFLLGYFSGTFCIQCFRSSFAAALSLRDLRQRWMSCQLASPHTLSVWLSASISSWLRGNVNKHLKIQHPRPLASMSMCWLPQHQPPPQPRTIYCCAATSNSRCLWFSSCR